MYAQWSVINQVSEQNTQMLITPINKNMFMSSQLMRYVVQNDSDGICPMTPIEIQATDDN